MSERVLASLREMFVGKRVRISHTLEELGVVEGACVAIHPSKVVGTYDLELNNRSLFWFIPEIFSERAVRGPLFKSYTETDRWEPMGVRTITIIA